MSALHPRWSMQALGRRTLSVLSLAVLSAGPLQAANDRALEPAQPQTTFARLPIKEVTVFKDGHAFVAHEGELPTNEKGNIIMDYLPTPVLGTFWPYLADKGAKLTRVVAGQRRVAIERTALNLSELLQANEGAEVIITEWGTNRYPATVVGVPARTTDELARTSPPCTPEKLPERANLILLKTAEGVKAVPLDHIQDVTFKGSHKSTGSPEEFRNLLTLDLDWGRAKPSKSANVGLFYLQKGMRWIPNYKVEIDGRSSATVKLQATLINELADLDDVSVNLVIGVPSFAFKDSIDPMALQQNLAQLSQYFQADGSNRNSPLAYNFSNAIMTQQMRGSDYRTPGEMPGSGSLGPEIGEGGQSEDLFVFNVQHMTLRKGERMVLTVAEFTLPYQDLFTLELPFSPPPEVRCNMGSEQQRELARLFNAPKVMHKIRLTNTSRYPLTTAPALVLRDGRVLAQSLMSFASAGATEDLPITTALEFQAKRTDLETKRAPDAIRVNGSSYSRIDLQGTITLTSHRAQPTELEVTRSVLGNADATDHDGKLEKVNVFDSGEFLGGDYPYWWNWYGWPSWWSQLNGIGRITWKITLVPNQPVDLGYQWHYFWQ